MLAFTLASAQTFPNTANDATTEPTDSTNVCAVCWDGTIGQLDDAGMCLCPAAVIGDTAEE